MVSRTIISTLSEVIKNFAKSVKSFNKGSVKTTYILHLPAPRPAKVSQIFEQCHWYSRSIQWGGREHVLIRPDCLLTWILRSCTCFWRLGACSSLLVSPTEGIIYKYIAQYAPCINNVKCDTKHILKIKECDLNKLI